MNNNHWTLHMKQNGKYLKNLFSGTILEIVTLIKLHSSGFYFAVRVHDDGEHHDVIRFWLDHNVLQVEDFDSGIYLKDGIPWEKLKKGIAEG